jgi:4-amino-4-deoxy-L-arabinose transferase-like glycosyltransferase
VRDIDVRATLRLWLALARPHWPLLPALLVGAALRFWGLLPAFLYGDEAEYATVARGLASDPRRLAYPPLEGFGPTPFVSQPPALLYAFAAAAKVTGSAVAGPLAVSALLGTATLVAVYAIGVLVRDRWLGGLAAGFLAVLPFHIAVSRSAQLDSGFTFLFTLSILLFLAWLRRPTLGRALALGSAVALTAMAKLPGILVLVPILLVLGLRTLFERRERARTALQVLAAGIPLAVLTLGYIAHLWLLHATTDWVQKLGWQAARVEGEAGTIERGWEWYFTANVGLAVQWGWVLMALALVGLGIALWGVRDRGRRWLMLTLALWPLAVLAFLLASQRKEWFYALPLSPPAVLLASLPIHAAAGAAWRASRPLPGQAWHRAPGALLCVVGLFAVAAFAPVQFHLQRTVSGPDYGYGLREAAQWIHGQDPDAAQVGTTLGRFSLHFYNGHPTYHYYVNHTWLHEQAAAGKVHYVVRDPYLNLTYERQWLADLVAAHNGTLVQSFDNGHGRRVEVYRLAAA